MHFTTEANRKRIEDHHYNLEKIKKRTENYEELIKYVNEVETQRKIMDARFNQEIDVVKSYNEMVREKLRVTNSDVE